MYALGPALPGADLSSDCSDKITKYFCCSSDDLYELIGYVGDDEAQYECRTCMAKAGKPVPKKADWLVALEKNRLKGFSIVCASILDKKYSHPVAKIDEEELKSFYDKHKEGNMSAVIEHELPKLLPQPVFMQKYDFIQ